MLQSDGAPFSRLVQPTRFRTFAWVRLAIGSSVAAAVGAVLAPSVAWAHVKWFAPFDLGEAPLPPAEVVSPLLLTTAAAACLALWLGSRVEQTAGGQRVSSYLNMAAEPLAQAVEMILRVAVGGFFLSLWAHGGVLLTPELTTAAPAAGWAQLGIALAMLHRRLLCVGSAGILALFAAGVAAHGAFHMLDYLFFPGTALCLALIGSRRDSLHALAQPLLRTALAASLMWVSIEKFVYPHWTVCILQQHPLITFGFEPHVLTQIAGIVEFSLAFGLLWTPLVRRAAAAALALLMTLAILEFGKIDAIGHMLPIALLIAIALDRAPGPAIPHRMALLLLPVALVALSAAYYAAHATLI